MNCSLWKPSVPQPPPTRAGSWEEVRGHIPQPSHPHCVVQRLAEPGRIPGFLFLVLQLAHCLFYIFIFTRRESPPQPARRKPWGGRGRPRASSREPPSLCAHAHCWDQGAPWVSPWVAAVWATPPHAALGAWCLRGLGQSSFTHSPNRDPSRAPPPGARRQEKRRSSPSLPPEEPTGDRREPMLSGTHGVGEAGGEVSRQSPPREAAGSLLSRGNLMAWRDGVWLSWRGRWGRWNHGDGIGEASRLRSWGRGQAEGLGFGPGALGSPAEGWRHVLMGMCPRGCRGRVERGPLGRAETCSQATAMVQAEEDGARANEVERSSAFLRHR